MSPSASSVARPPRRSNGHAQTEKQLGTSALSDYLTRIRALPRQLPREEERALVKRMKAGDHEARVALFEAHLWWVQRCAKAYIGERASHEDLTQVGNLTLWRVLPGYDARRRVRVISYVTPALTRDLRLASAKMSAVVARPRWVLEMERRLDQLLLAHLAEHGTMPSAAMIAQVLDLPKSVAKAVQQRHAQRAVVVSLEQMRQQRAGRRRGPGEVNVGMADGFSHESIAQDSVRRATDPAELYERDETAMTMRKSVTRAGLTSREMELVGLIYGRDLSQAEAAQRMRISPQRVSELHASALARIKDAHLKAAHEQQQGQ